MRGLVILLVAGCGSSAAGSDAAADDAAVPDDGMSSCPSGQWCTEAAPVSGVLLHAVWAVDPGVVFAVGSGGVILRRQNNAWTHMTSTTTANLTGVWAASATDAWAVGEAGTILRYNGSVWSPQAGLSGDLGAVLGFATDDVYITGLGSVAHWNGATFTTQAIPGAPFALTGVAANDVWVTGEDSRVSHFTDTWTTGISPGAGNTYFTIHQVAANDVWVSNVTAGSETLRFDGKSWIAHTAGAGTVFQGFRSISAADIWAAGGSEVGHWDGTAWTTEQPAGAAAQFFAIHGSGTFIWVVGSDSAILHRN
ncbi:MAG: hypothetical protein ABI867_11395 [Kofleriaceae bacterium]